MTTALLPATMTAGTLMYAMLAVLATFIIDDLGITRAQLGWTVGVYSIVSAAASPFVGRVTDRIGARRAMLSAFGFSAAGFVFVAASTTLPTLLAASAVVAVGQALANPSTNKMIGQEFPPGRRGLVTGFKQSGVQAGTFVAGVSFPVLAERLGWRGVPLILVAVILGLFSLGWLALPTAEDGAPAARRRGAAGRLPQATYWTAAFAFLMGAGGSPVFSFLPLYGTEALGVSEATAGLVVGVTGLVGMGSRIGWSIFAERDGDFPKTMLIVSLLSIVAGVLTVSAQYVGLWMLWAASVVGFLSISGWNSVAMLSVISEAGEKAGRASGVVLMGFLTGLAISPPVFGWSVDRLGTYTPGYTGVTILFGLASLTMLGWIVKRRSLQVSETPARPA